ncbi:MAG: penicillin-binding protein activator [Pseudohongiellaceae bacterium]
MFTAIPVPLLRTALALLLVLLAACASSPPLEPDQTETGELPDNAAEYLDRAARQMDGQPREQILLAAGESALEEGNPEAATELLTMLRESMDDMDPESTLYLRSLLLEGDVLSQAGEPAAALRTLNTLPAPRWQAASETLYRQWLEQRIRTLLELDQHLAAVRDHIALGTVLPEEQRQASRNRIWEILTAIPAARLENTTPGADSYELRGWLELLTMTRSRPDNIEDQISIIEQWRNRWNQHSAADVLPDALAYLVELWESRPTRLALLLPLQQRVGEAVLQGFMSAYYHALEQELDVPGVRIYDTSERSRVLTQYRQAVEDGAQLVIGPLDKEAVRALQRRSTSLPVPTLALNYTDNDLISPENLYQFGLAPEDDIRQLTRTARLNHHQLAAALTPAGGEYERIRELFEQRWQELGGEVINSSLYTGSDSYSTVLEQLLNVDSSQERADRVTALLPREEVSFIPRRRQDIDYLFLLASPEQGRQIAPTLDFFYAGDVPVHAMPSIHDGGADPGRNRDLDGILFTELPWLLEGGGALKQQLDATWPSASGAVQRLRALGIDSYRLHTRLGQLLNYPDTRMQGVTGTLALRGDGAIERIVPIARFSNGIATRLAPVSPDEALSPLRNAGR